MSELRPYQRTAIESALQALTNSGSAVLQAPTGAGKTRMATEIIGGAEGPVWFVCHRQEIERQAAKAFAAVGIDFGIVSPRGTPEYDKPVQVASVATLTRRLTDLPPPSLVIWDECHHVAAKSWAEVREQIADAKHLGLTATPERLDGKGLSEWFSELVVSPSTRELIDAGYLSDFRYFAPSEPDLTGAKLRAGDYRKEDVAKAMNVPVLIGDAIAEYRAKAASKRAIVFCASVEASRMLVERFNEAGIPARHADGTTPTAERDEAVAQLASGEIKVLSNVDVFTEGFDLPAIDAVILLRPTKSLALFLQMVGRVLRRAEGKSEALIFDHAGLWLDHDWFDLPISWSLDGGARKRRLAGRTHGPRRCPECKEVRAERAPVCDCGYEFPTGREIGEYDGELREMRGVAPEGCARFEDFAKRFGLSEATIRQYTKKGMPVVRKNIVNISECEIWLKDNPPKRIPPLFVENPESYISVGDFSKLIERTFDFEWYALGIPHASNGWIDKIGGISWVSSRKNLRTNQTKSEDYVSKTEFARIAGLKRCGTVTKLIKSGMPASENGWVIPAVGLAWMKSRKIKTAPPADEQRPGDFESKKDFCRRIGVSITVVKRLEKLGLRTASNGWVHISEGTLFWERNKSFLMRLRDRNTYREHPKALSRRLGISATSAYRLINRSGLKGEDGLADIAVFLEWVRDNTDTPIPPEAWPSANDNPPPAAEAA